MFQGVGSHDVGQPFQLRGQLDLLPEATLHFPALFLLELGLFDGHPSPAKLGLLRQPYDGHPPLVDAPQDAVLAAADLVTRPQRSGFGFRLCEYESKVIPTSRRVAVGQGISCPEAILLLRVAPEMDGTYTRLQVELDKVVRVGEIPYGPAGTRSDEHGICVRSPQGQFAGLMHMPMQHKITAVNQHGLDVLTVEFAQLVEGMVHQCDPQIGIRRLFERAPDLALANDQALNVPLLGSGQPGRIQAQYRDAPAKQLQCVDVKVVVLVKSQVLTHVTVHKGSIAPKPGKHQLAVLGTCQDGIDSLLICQRFPDVSRSLRNGRVVHVMVPRNKKKPALVQPGRVQQLVEELARQIIFGWLAREGNVTGDRDKIGVQAIPFDTLVDVVQQRLQYHVSVIGLRGTELQVGDMQPGDCAHLRLTPGRPHLCVWRVKAGMVYTAPFLAMGGVTREDLFFLLPPVGVRCIPCRSG